MTAVPEALFRELLPQIEDAIELKLVLYLLWRVARQERPVPFVRRSEVVADTTFMESLGNDEPARIKALDRAFDQAVERGVAFVASAAGDALYLLNTPKGRAALQGYEQGQWSPDAFADVRLELGTQRPNIFELYEQNIGPLTPMIAESLRDAEAEYPYEWVEEAVRIALENNVRKWRYVEAILKSWQEKGRNDRKDQQDTEKERRKYVEGEFSDYIES